MDNRSKEARCKNMSHIPSKNAKPEEKVRRYLFSQGFRYRKNATNLLRKSDIVLPRYNAVFLLMDALGTPMRDVSGLCLQKTKNFGTTNFETIY